MLTTVSGYSRMLAVMIPTRRAQDVIAGHWRVLSGGGAVPRGLVWNGESALSSRRGGTVKLSDES